jgi:signal peptidase I
VKRSREARTRDREPGVRDIKPVKKSTPREYFESLCVAVILALFIRTFVFQTFSIPSGSMEETLVIGDHLIVDKFGARPVTRGQILVFKSPEEPQRDLIKRVIGLPGETIEVRGRTVYVGGKPLDEPYVQFLLGDPAAGEAAPGGGDLRRNYGPVTVPPDHYFMMGDNRDNSRDSRFWGFMPRDFVRGRALFVYFSLGDSLNGIRWDRILHQIH